MSRIVFSSLANSNLRYVVSSSDLRDDWRNRDRTLSDRIGVYDTMGDGDTAHTPDGAVGPVLFLDFLRSCAVYLAECSPGVRNELCGMLAREMGGNYTSPATVKAAAGVVYKEGGKRRYYEKQEFKVSAAESRQHDKRWSEVVEWMDGSFSAVVGLLGIVHGSILSKYATIYHVGEIWQGLGNDSYGTNPLTVLEWLEKEAGDKWAISLAFRAVLHFVRSFVEFGDGVRDVESIRRNMGTGAAA